MKTISQGNVEASETGNERAEEENRIHCLASRDAFYKDRSSNKVVCFEFFSFKRDFHQAKFLGGWDEGYIVAEMMFLLLLAILAVYELYQVLPFTMKYQKYPCRLRTLSGFD